MNENQDKILINESKPFDKQVDDVLSGVDTESSHLEVLKVTPPLLRMVGVPNLPILMTANHLKTITQESGTDSANYHGLGVELVKRLPELISDPVMIMDSISPDAKAKNSIVIVTQMVDKENRPVIGAIKLNGVGRKDSKIISANILTSAYGKDNFQSFIKRNIEQGSVLYIDKEKSQALSVNPGIQFPDVMASLSFNTIIRKTNAFVNREEEKSVNKTGEQRRPLLVNLFAGPSAGKTTAALELTAALKKKGYNVEYVSEFAKELVLENKTEFLKNQEYVTDEQYHRLDRLRNSGVEIIVTDSPVLLGKIYGETTISKEYSEKLLSYHNSFDNFNLFVNRGETFQTEGRVHNLEQSREIDKKIIAMLREHKVFYGTYYHDEIDKTVDRISRTLGRLSEQKVENTEKNEESMKADTNNITAQTARERVQQVRDEMVKTLLEHIEKNPTDWQSGWNNIAAGAPYNGKTNTVYRGMNALYLACIGMQRGYKDTRWVTFNQAKELGASVKKGEKSSPVIFFEFYDRATKKAFDSRTVKDMTEEEKAAYLKENVYVVMKYSSVFNAEQCHNFPERKEIAMSEEERANQNVKIETIIANSAAPVRYDGGSRAYYSPGTDSIHLPAIAAFDTMQDYYATALHEIAHSTGHESRLNRDLSGGFGSENYAKEELRAELACVFMQIEQGIQLEGKHIVNHAAYLNSWLEAAKRDTSVFFKAAADAQKIADYVADNYLQAADVAVTEEESEAQEQPERNPMADYLRAESEKRAEEIRTVDRLRAGESSIQLNYYDYTRRGAFIEGITAAPRNSFYGGHIAIINNNEQLEVDKPAGYILTSGGYSPNSGDYIDAAYGFETYEEAREYCVEHYGIDVGESTAEQGLNQNIKDWYSRAYPNDSAGQDIRSEATFNDLQDEVHRADAKAVYGMLGEDSIIRERAFSHLSALTNTSYSDIYSAFLGETPAQRLANARAQARRLAAETGEPYVTFEDAERGLGNFPGIKKYTVMSLSEADKELYILDMVANENNGYYKTKIHIDFVIEGKPNSYENCRFDIGTEHGGLVHHIDEFLKNDTSLDAQERAEAETDLEYFKRHMEVSQYLAYPEKLAELSEDEQRFVNEYVDQARYVLNTTAPFSDYYDNMPLTPEELKSRDEARNAAHAAGLPFYEGTDEQFEEFEKAGGLVYDGNMSVEDYKRMLELREQGAGAESAEVQADEQANHAIDQYVDTLAKKGENVIVADGTNIRKHKAKIDLTEKRLREYADTLRRNDLEVGNTAQTDEYYLNQAREQIAAYERSDEYRQALREDFPNDFIDDSPQDMAQIPQNQQNIFCTDFGGEYRYFLANDGLDVEDICNGYAINPVEGFAYSFGREITEKQYKDIQSIGKGFNIDFLDDINAFTITQDGKVIDSGYLYEDLVLKYQERQNKPVEAQERKREWLSIELPDVTVGGQYGENTMIKMPKGEFSGYALFMPTKLIREENGKKHLRVASDFDIRLNNDGRQVELTGKELADSFNGVRLDKTYKRVAPSRRFAKGLENLEKNVPSELRNMQWCCYRTRWNDEKGKKEKFIISPIDGKWASSKEPDRWVSFENALKYARENNCEGLSVLLDKQSGITCIDLDKCILNAETGEMKERATRLVNELKGTYIERSTSGNGVHIFLKDDILKNGTYNSTSMVKDDDPKGDLEVYDDKRIISMTGDMISETNTLTRAGSAATVYLRQELGEKHQFKSSGGNTAPKSNSNLSDAELIRWIRSSKQGSKFDDLYAGRGVSGDKSADDAKMAHLLLYFNGGDETQAFRIMRESGLYRQDKPDSYYLGTIKKMNGKIEEYAHHPNSLSAEKKQNKGFKKFGGKNSNGPQA